MNLNLWPFTFKTAHDGVFRADVQPRSEVDEFKNRATVFDSGRNRAMPDGRLARRHDDPFAGDETESDGRAIIRFSSRLLPGHRKRFRYQLPSASSVHLFGYGASPSAQNWKRRPLCRIKLRANVPSVF
jgi:hypothetical protein